LDEWANIELAHTLSDYAHERWDTGKRLPWAMIDSGTGADKLELELELAETLSASGD